jgi:hypothetical protein
MQAVRISLGLTVTALGVAVACGESDSHRRAVGVDAGEDAADSSSPGGGGRTSAGGRTSTGGAPVTSSGGARTTGGAPAGGAPSAGGAARDASAEASAPDATPDADAAPEAAPPCTEAACSPYACGDGGCTSTCSLGGEGCASDATCYDVGGDGPPLLVCLKAQGGDCTSDTQCRTSHCTDGKCCDTACTSYCDPATNTSYAGATCATGTCAGSGASAPCPNNLPCLGNESCMTDCYTVWVGGFPATGFPTGLNFGNCIPSAPYCNCIPSVSGGNCTGTACCATFPCN